MIEGRKRYRCDFDLHLDSIAIECTSRYTAIEVTLSKETHEKVHCSKFPVPRCKDLYISPPKLNSVFKNKHEIIRTLEKFKEYHTFKEGSMIIDLSPSFMSLYYNHDYCNLLPTTITPIAVVNVMFPRMARDKFFDDIISVFKSHLLMFDIMDDDKLNELDRNKFRIKRDKEYLRQISLEIEPGTVEVEWSSPGFKKLFYSKATDKIKNYVDSLINDARGYTKNSGDVVKLAICRDNPHKKDDPSAVWIIIPTDKNRIRPNGCMFYKNGTWSTNT